MPFTYDFRWPHGLHIDDRKRESSKHKYEYGLRYYELECCYADAHGNIDTDDEQQQQW